MIDELNKADLGAAVPATVRGLIDSMAARRPDETFLLGPETGGAVSFLELQRSCLSLSARLRGAGLEAGDKVAFLMDNGVFTAQLFLATMYAGLVAVPLNLRAGVPQLAFTLEHSDAGVVLVSQGQAGLLQEVLPHVGRSIQVCPAEDFARLRIADCGLRIEESGRAVPALNQRRDAAATLDGGSELPGASKEANPQSAIRHPQSLPPLSPADPALLMYTSGSTGQPRAAVHTHRSLLAHARNSVLAHQLTAADRSLLVLPLYHINAECVTLLPSLLAGGSVVIPSHFAVSQFWDWLEENRCTWTAVVPTIISQLLDWKDPKAGLRQAAFARIRFMRSSSAPLSPSLHREFIDKFKLPLIQAMGCTEAGNVFSNPVPPGVNKIGSPGLPWGFEARIVNREGAEVAEGEAGEVLLRGAGMMSGYYKDAVATEASLDGEGWLHTGDLAYRDGEGYFFVVGRSKELIIKGGMNISPKQVDEALESHGAVLEAAAVGVPDRYVGEDVVAFVVLRKGARCEERELLSFCEGKLGHFKTPTRIHFVQDLPKGPSGKVQRLRLVEEASRPALAKSVSLAGQEPVAGQTAALEETISGIWTELLKQPKVGAEDNFFALGGTSLLAIQCLSRLRDKVPVPLSISDFFENASVAQLALLLCGRQTGAAGPQDAATPIPPRDRTRPCPLSPAQQRIWFFRELAPLVPLYNESEAVLLKGELQVEAMERALNVVIARHEILRSTIAVVEEQPSLIVHEEWPLRFKQLEISALEQVQRQAEVERLLVEEPRLPYNLEKEPGIRATLLRLSAREHVFILMMHHLVCDWSSEGVLWREMSAAYHAFVHGEALTLAPLPVQFGDYAAWQQQQTEAVFAGDLEFWERNLKGAPGLLELPSDRPRPPELSYRGARRRFCFGGPLVEALRDCSRRERVSLFTVFAAALDVVLYRYTGREDILLGIPLADRERAELQPLIGFLLHTQVLRARLSDGLSCRELLAQVQKAVLELYSHSAAPFDRVVNRLQPERNLSYSPLFQVMLNWRDRDQLLSVIGMDGLEVESLLAESRTSKFDLTVMLTDCGEEVWMELEYGVDLFDAGRMERLAGHYETVLEALAAGPERPLRDLPLLTATERLQLAEYNQTLVPNAEARCVHELIEEQAVRAPDAVAVEFENQHLTYGALNDRANQLARRLRGMGVGPGARAALCVERSLDMIVGLLGILKAGGAYVPLDPEYPAERLAFMLEDSGARVVLTQNSLVKSLPQTAATVLRLDAEGTEGTDGTDAKRPENDSEARGAGPEDLAYLIYTSGSTGRPKGVEVRHGSLANFLQSMRRSPGISAQDKVLALTTICFDIAGLEMWLPLTAGARIVVVPRDTAKDGTLLAELAARSQATLIQATPSTWRLLLAAGWEGGRNLKLLCGGEPWSLELARPLLERCGSLWNMYGPTETTIWSAASQIRAGDEVLIGGLVANTQFYVADSNLRLLPVGVAGELLIGGAGLARGYHSRPELTAEKFPANPFGSGRVYRTGDLVRWREGGRIEFIGRADHQVKLRGFRIELGEIESVLNQHPGVQTSTVAVREDISGDKRLVAYLVSRNGPLGSAELQQWLRIRLPDYMVPTAFVSLKALPLTPNGKVDRKALPRPDLEAALDKSKFQPPQSPAEVALAKIWGELLGIKQVGVRDNFFALGGHSLLAMSLQIRIEKELGRRLALLSFFQNPTIAELALVLSSQATPNRRPSLTSLNTRSAGPSLVFLIGQGSMGLYNLAELLKEECALYAASAPFPEAVIVSSTRKDYAKLPSMEEMAAVQTALIKEKTFQGPLLLTGFCFRGMLAYETARQLRAAGVEVAGVILLDTWMRRATRMWRRKIWIQGHIRTALSKGPKYVWKKLRSRVEFEKDRSSSERALIRRGNFDGEVPWVVMERIYLNAMGRYRPKSLDCRGVVIEPKDDWWVRARYPEDPTLGAGALFEGGVKVVEVPENHVDVLNQYNLPELARAYRAALRYLKDEKRDEDAWKPLEPGRGYSRATALASSQAVSENQ